MANPSEINSCAKLGDVCQYPGYLTWLLVVHSTTRRISNPTKCQNTIIQSIDPLSVHPYTHLTYDSINLYLDYRLRRFYVSRCKIFVQAHFSTTVAPPNNPHFQRNPRHPHFRVKKPRRKRLVKTHFCPPKQNPEFLTELHNHTKIKNKKLLIFVPRVGHFLNSLPFATIS